MTTPYQLHRAVRSTLLNSPMDLLQHARVETRCFRENVHMSTIIHPNDEQKYMVVQVINDPATGFSTVEYLVDHWFPRWLQIETITDIAKYLDAEDAEILTPTPDDTTLVDDARSVATL